MGLIEYLNSLQLFQRCSDEYIGKINSYFSDYRQSPQSLCKYLDFDGGISSLTNSNLQFSCPLKFHKAGPLSDDSELSLQRIFVDENTQKWLIEYFKKNTKDAYLNQQRGFKEQVGYLIYCYLTNYIQRQGISCLTERPNNKYLWEHAASNFSGICIEYNTEIIDLFSVDDTLCARVAYFDKIEQVDFQFISSQPLYKHFLFNLFFVKKRSVYQIEEEFRIIKSVNLEHNKLIKYNVDDVIDGKLADGTLNQLPIERVTVPQKMIHKIYYTDSVKDEDGLLNLLSQKEIRYEKINRVF